MRSEAKQVRKFLNLASGDRRLLVRAAFWVAAVRLLLWFLPFSRLRGFMARNGEVFGTPSLAELKRMVQVSWAVGATARYIPRATCLTQALAAQALLRREGIPASLCLGVAKDRNGKFQAHAWLEQEGNTILGHCQEQDYTPFQDVSCRLIGK